MFNMFTIFITLLKVRDKDYYSMSLNNDNDNDGFGSFWLTDNI